jgi:ParB-like chromosome segregation protein Spo0J
MGMTRLAAHRLLAAGGVPGEYDRERFAEMDVQVQPLGDREMFETGVTENVKRQDLTPIEVAAAMRRYSVEFGASSVEIGYLFNCEPGTARNKMGLLNLPAAVQDMMHSGELAERVGRSLVTLARIDGKKAEATARQILKQGLVGEDVEDEIARALGSAAKELASGWEHGVVDGMWSIGDKAPPGSKHVTHAQLLEAVKDVGSGETLVVNGEKLSWEKAVVRIATALEEGITPSELVALWGCDGAVVAQIHRLLAPPACSGCPEHSVLGGAHYCAWPVCYRAKKDGWRRAELLRVQRRKETKGIQEYVRSKDGEAFDLERMPYGVEDKPFTDKCRQLLAAGSGDLRLKAMGTAQYRELPLTGSKWVKLVVVGDEGEALRKRLAQRQAARQKAAGAGSRRWEQFDRNAKLSKFVVEACVPHVAKRFTGLTTLDTAAAVAGLLLIERGWERSPLADWHTTKLFEGDDPRAKPAQRIAGIQLELARSLVHDVVPRDAQGAGPKATVKWLEKWAKATGVRLPATWAAKALEQAAEVDAETPKGEQPAVAAGVDDDED